MVTEDNDYALVSVVLFKRVIDDFKTACRSKGFQASEMEEGTGRGLREWF